MRALTVQQPWAWAIIHGGKTIENRTQVWKHRGPLAIHAGQRWSDRGAEFEPLQRAYAKWLGFDHWSGPYGGRAAMPIDHLHALQRIGGIRLHIYRCRGCKGWHVGHYCRGRR